MNKKLIAVAGITAIVGLGYWFNKVKLSNEPTKTVSQKEKDKLQIVLPAGQEEINFVFDFVKDQGFFEKHDLDVEKIPVAKNSFQSFMTGQGDAYIAGSSSPIAAYYNNNEPRILADLFHVANIFVVSKFNKEQIASVKKVGVTTIGSEIYLTARLMLEALGINPDSVEYIILPENDARAMALEKGHVDLIVISSEAVISKMGAREKFNVFDSSILPKDVVLDKYLTSSKKIINEKPDQLLRLVAAFYEGLTYMDENSEEVISFVQKNKSFTREQAEKYQLIIKAARENVSFVPDLAMLNVTAEDARRELKLESFRDLKDIMYSDFANEIEKGNRK